MNIQEAVNKQLLKEQEKWGTRQRSGKWSPSMFGACLKRQYYNRLNEPKTTLKDERTLRMLRVGNIFEDWIRGVLIDKEVFTYTVRVETDDVLGYADFVNTDEVIDLKTQNSRKFWYINKEIKAGKKIEDILYNNWMQVMFYSWKLEKPFAKLCLVSRDDMTMDEYRLPVDNYWKNELDMELTKLNYFWGKKVLPPAEPKLYSGKECTYCDWKETCQKKEEA